MIRYALRCGEGHAFDAWFRNSAAFEEQRAAGQVRCAVCASGEVEKSVMAPSVVAGGDTRPPRGRRGGAAHPAGKAAEAPSLDAPASPAEAALVALRKAIESRSDYVGTSFAEEARKMHEGEAAARPIWGEATLADAKSLSEDGIPVTPIPFMRRRGD